MNQIKKHQHYVWRSYLRSWTNNDRICTYFKESGKTIELHLTKICVEKDYYKLIDCNDIEEEFLKNFIESHSFSEAAKRINYHYLHIFTSPSKYKNKIKKLNIPHEGVDEITHNIKMLETNLMEEFHSSIESMGKSLLQCKSLEDIKNITKDEYLLFSTFMFLIFQWFRTKRMKKAMLKKTIVGCAKDELLIKKFWNIIVCIFATNLACNLYSDENLKYIFIENKTDNHFITSDQPVFNLYYDKLNENGEISEFGIYYPITPNHAIEIHIRTEQIDQFVTLNASDEAINFLNQKVLEYADYFVFADSEKQLRGVVNRFSPT